MRLRGQAQTASIEAVRSQGRSATTNICELQFNVVIFNKPKVLTGLNQNGVRSGVVLGHWATMDVEPPAKMKGPIRSESQAEQGKPVALPLCGRPTERTAVGAAGKGMQKKRMSSCNGANTDCDIIRRESEPTSAWSFMAR